MNLISKFLQTTAPASIRLLLIDDEDLIRQLYISYFTRHGCIVTPAATLAKAEISLRAGSFDIVLQDVVLPDGDGINFLPKIKEIQPDLPVIILTGLGYDEEAFQDAIRHKATSYISKLLPLDQVLLEIRRILRPKAAPQPPLPDTAPAEQAA